MNTHAFENRVWEYIGAHGMIAPGERVLCAVSGGADSMCLLHLLRALSCRFGFSLAAATYDHQIRKESAEDAEFVRQACAQWEIPCCVGAGDVPERARQEKAGLEETARKMRYAFLEGSARKIGAQSIAVAHNADDNAETVLLHLLRGSGLQGLGGIAPVRGRIIRPLLAVSREEIEAYCRERGIEYRSDVTNADVTYSRNYLRHQVLPLLRERNPRLLTTLGRTAESLRRDSEYLNAQAEKLLERTQRGTSSVSCPAPELLALPEALSFRLVDAMARELRPETVLSAAQRERVLQLCRSVRPGASCPLGGGLTARRVYDRLEISAAPEQTEEKPVLLRAGESVCFHGRELCCEEALCPEGRFNRPWEYCLRPVEVLLLRAPEQGEHITLPSRPRKEVKRLLSQAKVPLHLRPMAIALEAEGQLAALDGFGADIHFLPVSGQLCWKITSRPVEEIHHPNHQKKENDYGTGKGY